MSAPSLDSTPAATYFRLHEDLTRHRVHRLDVPRSARPEFWSWYADRLRGPGTVKIRVTEGPAGSFPEPTGRLAMWSSTGMGSAHTLRQISHLSPDVLHYEDFATEVEPVRAGAPLPLVLAVLGAHLGYSFCYLGAVRTRACGAPDRSGGEGNEDGPAGFAEGWNAHHDDHRLRLPTADLTRDRLLAALPDGAEAHLSSCDLLPGGWCRDCAKCFMCYYTAKAVGRPLGFTLSGRIFDAIYLHRYRPYLGQEFAADPSNSLQYLVYLQMTYGVTFDRDADVG